MITIKEEFCGSTKTQRAIELGGYEAIFLWLCLKAYVSVGNTGGFIPREDVPNLPGVPKRWQRSMAALVDCGKQKPDGSRGDGLVEPHELGWMLHDYEDHGTMPEVEDIRRRKAREQKRRRREELRLLAEESSRGQKPDDSADRPPDSPPDNDRTSPRTEQDNSPQDCPADGPRSGAGTGPLVRGHGRDPSPAQPPPGGKDLPPAGQGQRRRDPFDLAKNRQDVRELFDAWKRTFGYSGARLDIGSANADADILAERLDAHGLEECLRVLAYAPNDGMVSGRDDERRQKHDTVRYIFGNHAAFQRLQRDASKHRPDGSQSVSETLERLRGAEA